MSPQIWHGNCFVKMPCALYLCRLRSTAYANLRSQSATGHCNDIKQFIQYDSFEYEVNITIPCMVFHQCVTASVLFGQLWYENVSSNHRMCTEMVQRTLFIVQFMDRVQLMKLYLKWLFASMCVHMKFQWIFLDKGFSAFTALKRYK